MSSYYLKRNGKLYGPFSDDKLKILINNGTFGEMDQVTSDQISWQSVQDFRITMNIPYNPVGTSVPGYDPTAGYDPNTMGYDPNTAGYATNTMGYDPNYVQGSYIGKPRLWYCLFVQPRMSRKDFWIIFLIVFLLNCAANGILYFAMDDGMLSTDEFDVISGLLGLITNIFWIPLTLHRLHDSGKNGVSLIIYWTTLIITAIAWQVKEQEEFLAICGIALILSSLYIFILSVLPGTPGPNRYGNEPARIF